MGPLTRHLAGTLTASALGSVLYTAPVCLLISETIAWVAGLLARSQEALSAG